jgi:hypothetical protein
VPAFQGLGYGREHRIDRHTVQTSAPESPKRDAARRASEQRRGDQAAISPHARTRPDRAASGLRAYYKTEPEMAAQPDLEPDRSIRQEQQSGLSVTGQSRLGL